MRVAETIVKYGAAEHSDADLLKVLGISGQTLEEVTRCHTFKGTKNQVAKLEALGELCRRAARPSTNMALISSPSAAGNYLIQRCAGWTEENFGIMVLNARGFLLADRIISRGTATATLISPREFFREALRLGGTSALAYHNHPSGDPTPSREDTQLTGRLRTAGDALGVPLSDHIVVGGGRWHSFRAAQNWDAR